MFVREGQIYVPPKLEATQRFLRDVMMGSMKYLKCSQIKVANVPQYKGLTVRNILKFATSKTNIDEFLPEYDYSKEPC